MPVSTPSKSTQCKLPGIHANQKGHLTKEAAIGRGSTLISVTSPAHTPPDARWHQVHSLPCSPVHCSIAFNAAMRQSLLSAMRLQPCSSRGHLPCFLLRFLAARMASGKAPPPSPKILSVSLSHVLFPFTAFNIYVCILSKNSWFCNINCIFP